MTFPATAEIPIRTGQRAHNRPLGGPGWALTCLSAASVAGWIASCGSGGPRVVHGTGPVVHEQRGPYRPTERIEIEGYTDLSIEVLPLQPGSLPESSGAGTVVFLEGAQDLLSWVDTSLSGDTLTISFRDGVRLNPVPSIEVHTSYLVQLTSRGSGDIRLSGLTPEATRGEALQLEFVGSADFQAEGEVGEVTVDHVGSGDLNMRFLHSREATYSGLGSGAAWIDASESVSASVLGSGDLHIHGAVSDERVATSKIGGGQVIRVRE